MPSNRFSVAGMVPPCTRRMAGILPGGTLYHRQLLPQAEPTLTGRLALRGSRSARGAYHPEKAVCHLARATAFHIVGVSREGGMDANGTPRLLVCAGQLPTLSELRRLLQTAGH